MKITIFGATGALGSECLTQALDAGHEVTVLVRSASKLPDDSRKRIEVVEGDGLHAADVEQALGEGTEAVLFAIGVDKHSPEDLCTDVTRHILRAMVNSNVRRLVWCGGGSTLVEEDQVTFGARIVQMFAQIFMSLKHRDKEHQYELLQQHPEVEWIGVSAISFADCAHAMVKMLEDDTWLSKAPIIQY
ncbi:MAG: NAD(P)H-binding protein [Deltaproteobacteria bacterium]|nr:NAD(P)H-binding protein [Deltaproteobacteria bacterium]